MDRKYLINIIGVDPLIKQNQICRDLIDEAKNYLDEIKKIRPKYLVVSSQNITYTKYKNCILRLYKTEKNIDHMAVRNPLVSSNNKYDIFIYEINVDLMPKCINPSKVDSYSRD
jgi:hypothetical protein